MWLYICFSHTTLPHYRVIRNVAIIVTWGITQGNRKKVRKKERKNERIWGRKRNWKREKEYEVTQRNRKSAG